MKEFLSLVFTFDLKGLLLRPTYNVAIQFFRAVFVGAIALIADAGLLWFLSLTGLYYLICAVFGFLLGVGVNYILSVKFVFKEKAPVGVLSEVAVYVIVGGIGLLLTIGFMWFFTEIVNIYFMISRVITAVLVFVWNFTSRKMLLYRRNAEAK